MKKNISMQLFTALSVVCIVVLLGGVLAWQNYSSVKKVLLTATGETVQHLTQALDERSRWLIQPPRSLLQLLSYSPVMVATTLPERLKRLPQLVESLKATEIVSAVYVGYPNGEFVLVRKLLSPAAKAYFSAPSGSEFLVQSVTLAPDNAFKGEWRFYGADLSLIQALPKPDYQFDPRTRPWFKQAPEQQDARIGRPYVFFTTGQVGLTLSQRGETTQAVVGMDISIEALNKQLQALMVTENTEVALLNADGIVIAHPNKPIPIQSYGDHEVSLPHVQELDSTSLSQVFQSLPPSHEPRLYHIDGNAWYGMQASMMSLDDKGSRFVVAVPAAELLRDAYDEITRELVWIGFISLLLVVVGWVVSQRISRPLRVLAEQVRARSEFDFSTKLGVSSFITEIRDLNQVLGNMSQVIEDFQCIALALNHGTKLDKMLDSVVQKLVETFRVQDGAVYLVQGDTGMSTLATSTNGRAYPAELALDPSHDDLTASLTTAFGDLSEYLYVPLKNYEQDLQGVLVFRLKPDQHYTGKAERTFKRFVHEVSSAAAVAIETRQLIEAQRQLLDAVIKLLANAIDAKSPYIGAHCERVPIIAESLINELIDAREGPYADFSMDETELYEFRTAAWLHDCGKISTPESVIDKATKLETQYNRIHEIRTRFEVLWRDAEVSYWQGIADGGDAHDLGQTLQRTQARLQDEFAFVAESNIGSESMENHAIDRLEKIGSQRWWRHFDNRLGLAQHEMSRLNRAEQALPVQEFLLADRPDHIVAWGDRLPPVRKDDPNNIWGFDMQVPDHANNLGELYNLSIRYGTLTPEERFKINEHIVHTIMMLKSLPLPSELKRMPDIAGTHHEKMDGTGYPRGLSHAELGIPERVMMIADVFEALTAADRPYKPLKTLSESLEIMTKMACTGHLDADLFRLFLTSGVHIEYGKKFLEPSQLDAVDVHALLARMDGNATA